MRKYSHTGGCLYGEFHIYKQIIINKNMKKIFLTLIILSLFSVKGQIGIQLTSLVPVSEIKTHLQPGYGIELIYFNNRPEDVFTDFYTFGYRVYDGKRTYNLDPSGQVNFSNFDKFENYKEYVFGSYADYRILDKPISPIIGIGANLLINTFRITNYINNIEVSSSDNTEFGFLIIPRVGVAFDLSYYFSLNAGLGYVFKINGPKKPVDKYLSPFIGIAFYFD